MMSPQQQEQVGAVLVLIIALALIVLRKRLRVLNAASWLVIVGGLVIAAEHAQFALSFALGLRVPDPQQAIPLPHARLHFFMARICTLVGMVLLGVIAHAVERRPSDWMAGGSVCPHLRWGLGSGDGRSIVWAWLTAV